MTGQIGAFLVIVALILFCRNPRIPEWLRQPVGMIVCLELLGFAIMFGQWAAGGMS